MVNEGKYTLNYSLTESQKEASDFIVKNIKKGISCASFLREQEIFLAQTICKKLKVEALSFL